MSNITDGLPDNLVKKAVRSYRFDSSSTIEERIRIQHWDYSMENGETRLGVNENEDTVRCTLRLDGDEHTVDIPKVHESVRTELYPIGNVLYDTVELMGVCARSDLPWADEVFCAFYWGDIADGELDDVSDSFENVRVLMQYFVPRRVEGEPPECAVTESIGETDFMTVDVRNATHNREANPWSYASFGVLYENPTVAQKLLNHENTMGESSQYSLTPPEEVEQPWVSME